MEQKYRKLMSGYKKIIHSPRLKPNQDGLVLNMAMGREYYSLHHLVMN